MGNQAQQSQELELWQVVSSPDNRGRRTKPMRSRAQTGSGTQRRGNVSGYNRAVAGNAGPSGAARMGNTRTVRPARTGNVRSSGAARTGELHTEFAVPARTGNTRSSGVARTGKAGGAGTVRAEYARPSGAVRTGNARALKTAGTVRTANIRPVNPRAGARTQAPKKKKPGKRARISQLLAFLWIAAMAAAIVFMGRNFYQSMNRTPVPWADKTGKTTVGENLLVVGDTEKKPKIREDFLTISEYNRPGTRLACVKNIFVHYTANPGTSAAQNRSYFESLGQTHERAASAHFIIGYEGEIVQCIPLEEEAYAVVERNGDSISIECCFLDEDGSFTQETYDSLIEMLAWLTDKYGLEPEDILRHYDCGGKICPKYYVEHEDAWQKLLDDVAHYTL